MFQPAPRRAAIALALLVLASSASAAAPVPTTAAGSRVEVVTPHHAAPDGVLLGTFSLPMSCAALGGAPVSTASTAECAEDVPETDATTGTVTGTKLGVSVEHHAVPAGLVGERTELLAVEVHEPGHLTITAAVPAGFDSEIVAASEATDVRRDQASWELGDVEPGMWTFRIDTVGVPAGVSELTEITVTHVVSDRPLIESSLDHVPAPQGLRTGVLRLLGDRDVDGAAPTFQDEDDHITIIPTSNGAYVAADAFSAVSNGTYHGNTAGHVGSYYGLGETIRALYDVRGVNSGAGLMVMYHGARTETSNGRELGLRWQTASQANAVPFLAHDVITPAAGSVYSFDPNVGVPRPTSVDGAGGRLVLVDNANGHWAVGHTTMSAATLRYGASPSQAGESSAVYAQTFEVLAVDGDIDTNLTGSAVRGEPVRIHAPSGWDFDAVASSFNGDARIEVVFGEDETGPFVELTPVIEMGDVAPMRHNGGRYVQRIPVAFSAARVDPLDGTPLSPKRLITTVTETIPGQSSELHCRSSQPLPPAQTTVCN